MQWNLPTPAKRVETARQRAIRRFVICYFAVFNLALLDQLVKAWAIAKLKGAAPIEVLPGLFNLAYVENRGCAWGMFQGQVWPLAIFGIAALVFFIWKRKSFFPPGRVGLVAQLTLYAGVIGNLFDRLFAAGIQAFGHGYVVDLFDFHWGVHHFPCFNLADVYINIAAGLLVLSALFTRKPAPEPRAG